MSQNKPNQQGNDRSRQGNQDLEQQSTGNKGAGQQGRQDTDQQGLQNDEKLQERRQNDQSDSRRSNVDKDTMK